VWVAWRYNVRASSTLFYFFSWPYYYYYYFFLYGYIRRAVKPFRYATNVTLLRCACMCATPPPLPVARVTPPPTNQRRIRTYTHTHTHAHTHTYTHSHTIPSRLVRVSSPLYTHTQYPPLTANSASSVAATSSHELGLEERVSPLRLHVLLRTFPNKNHPTDTLLKLISSTHVIYYYVVWYILSLRSGIIITTTTRSIQTTGVFFS